MIHKTRHKKLDTSTISPCQISQTIQTASNSSQHSPWHRCRQSPTPSSRPSCGNCRSSMVSSLSSRTMTRESTEAWEGNHRNPGNLTCDTKWKQVYGIYGYLWHWDALRIKHVGSSLGGWFKKHRYAVCWHKITNESTILPIHGCANMEPNCFYFFSPTLVFGRVYYQCFRFRFSIVVRRRY